MAEIKKRYVVDEQDRRIAVQIDLETFAKIEEVLEDVELTHWITDVQEEPALDLDAAKEFLIVFVPPENETGESRKPEGQGRIAALADELAKDPTPFRELSAEERSARLEKVMGVGRGLMSTSEEFAQRKLEEVEIEEQKLGR